MTDDVLISQIGVSGMVTLNRPQALNALSEEMVDTISDALNAWRDDDTITRVIITATGARAFCAGGDVRGLYMAEQAGQGDAAWFFRKEYHLNAALAKYPKPIISFMHGFVMGGGVGLGCHVSHRVIDPAASLAMPETRIGLVPDVGGTHLLAQMPGDLGMYFALTGAHMTGLQAVAGGFADYGISVEKWDGLIEALQEGADLNTLDRVSIDATGALDDVKHSVTGSFSGKTLYDLAAGLRGGAFANAFDGLSPISLCLTFQLIRAAKRNPGLPPALEREFRFTSRAVGQSDFMEGVRAALVDKDQSPNWCFQTLDDVPDDVIDGLLTPVSPPLFDDFGT